MMSSTAVLQQENELQITPFSPIGAEVKGIRLSDPLSEPTRARLRKAFTDHSVLAFRDQWLDAPQMMAAVQIFGEIFPELQTIVPARSLANSAQWAADFRVW